MKAEYLSMAKGVVVLGCAVAVAAWIVSGDPSSAGPPEGATFVGARKCRPCHFKRYKEWRRTKHASAWEVLPEADRARRSCYRCHVTGEGRPGGYVSVEKTPDLVAVNCESCHGPGSAHIASVKAEEPEQKFKALIGKVPGAVCSGCHNPHKTHEDYEKEAADHQTPASPSVK